MGRFINADSQIAGVGGDILGYNMFAYCMNNPVNMSDADGNWPKASKVLVDIAVAALGVAVVALCVVAAPVVGAGVATAAAIMGKAALCVAAVSATAALVKEVVENTSIRETYRDQNVYVMRNTTTKEVQYVGRTNDPVRRQAEHNRDPKKAHLDPLEVKFSGLTKIEARIAEQLVISAYTLQNLDNARREIAVGNVSGFVGKMDNIIHIFGGSAESGFLSLMGR